MGVMQSILTEVATSAFFFFFFFFFFFLFSSYSSSSSFYFIGLHDFTTKDICLSTCETRHIDLSGPMPPMKRRMDF
jgi:hypothetical protein